MPAMTLRPVIREVLGFETNPELVTFSSSLAPSPSAISSADIRDDCRIGDELDSGAI